MLEPLSPPVGCQLRAAAFDDLVAVHQLRTACSIADYGEVLLTEEQLRARWHASGFDLASDAWVDHLGVRRPWRGRGLGLALLRHAFAAFYQWGIREVRLSVDDRSQTNATRVYERAGMVTLQHYHIYMKPLVVRL